MAALEKSDFDQCASCRDCTLEAMRTQASFDLCAPFPISRFTDSTARVSKRLTDGTAGGTASIPPLTKIQITFRRIQTILEAQMVRPLGAKRATPGSATDRRRKREGPEPGRSNFGLFARSRYRATHPENHDAPE
jgi:hypothetical protein